MIMRQCNVHTNGNDFGAGTPYVGDTYTAHKKFMNTSTSAESVASFTLEAQLLENQTP